MELFSRAWDTLEIAVFGSRIQRAVAAIGTVAVIQLATLITTLFYLTRIIKLDQGGPMAKAAGICIVLGVLGFFLALVACLVVGMMLNYLANKPLRMINGLFQRLAQERADWSENMDDLPYPELKHVAVGYNAFMDSIRHIIESMRRSGLKIAIDSTRLHKIIDATSEETDSQKVLSEQASESSHGANRAIKEVAENVQFVSENTSANLGKARTSQDELELVATKVNDINETVGTFRKTVEELNRNSSSIMGIVTLINNISDQTNLLSLNATIEAARAGEHGKGFAVVAEEVRTLAKRIKPATEDIAGKINKMASVVEKTMSESDDILLSSQNVSRVINQTSDNFKLMITDFEYTDQQLTKISAAVDQLSHNNNEVNQHVEAISGLTTQVYTDMAASADMVRGLNDVTEKMQEMVSHYKTGQGLLDQIISKARFHRDHIQQILEEISRKGVHVFDGNYRAVPGTRPQKFTAAFTAAVEEALQAYYDSILEDIPGSIYALAIDRNGYLPTHHSRFSKAMTGNPEQDLLNSRNMRIYFSNQTEVRRATSSAPMLLQTYMRDTGEVINDLSMPITLADKHWGGFILGLNPEVFDA